MPKSSWHEKQAPWRRRNDMAALVRRLHLPITATRLLLGRKLTTDTCNVCLHM
jgi:hypothetical protein